METGDIAETVKEAMVLQKASSEDLAFEVELPEEPVVLAFDRRLVTQAVTNLVKNAREAIEPRMQEETSHKGMIRVRVAQAEDKVTIAVADNGIGLPQENRGRLTEPYMTTREKGTGLGLAIVNKIVDEHGGQMSFASGKAGGTIVVMRFARDPLRSEVSHSPEENDQKEMP